MSHKIISSCFENKLCCSILERFKSMITTQSDLSLNSNKIMSKHLTISMRKIFKYLGSPTFSEFWLLLLLLISLISCTYLNNHYECNKLSNECLFIYNLDTVFWLISQKKEAYKKLQGTWPCRLQNKVCQSFPLGNLLWHTSHWTWNDPLPPFWQDEAKGLVGLASQRSLKRRLWLKKRWLSGKL